MPNLRQLDLNWLSGGNLPTISRPMTAMLSESACYLLQEASHSSPKPLVLYTDQHQEIFALVWSQEMTDVHDMTYADKEEATEWGASAIAILIARELTGYQGVERTYKGGGFDYWMGDIIPQPKLSLDKKVRLEISGIRRGSQSALQARVRIKEKQVSPTNNQGFPAHIVVVEFSEPKAGHRVAE